MLLGSQVTRDAQPHWGAYSTPADPLAAFDGPPSETGEGRERWGIEGGGNES